MTETLFGNDSGDYYFVPAEIIRFLVALTAPKPEEKVLDVQLNPEVLLPILKTIGIDDVQYLQSYATLNEIVQAETSYDVILCSPTFGVFVKSPDGSNVPNEEFWLKWSISHLSNNGRFAIIVPVGLLSNYSQQAIREFLLTNGGIEAIIDLPSGWAQNTFPQASILLIKRNCSPDREIKMIRFPKAETIPWDLLISHISNGQLNITPLESDFALTIKASELDEHRLDAQYYLLKQAGYTPPDPEIFEEVRLADLVGIRSGERFSKEEFQPNGIPYVKVKNVTTIGTLDLRQVQTLIPDVAKRSRGYSRPGDILITTAGTIGKVFLIDASFSKSGVCIDTSLRRLEVFDTKLLLPDYLTLYLQTPMAQQQMKMLTTGSVIPILANPNLSELKVYVPNTTKQREIIAIFKDPTLDYQTKVSKSFYGGKPEPTPTPPTLEPPSAERTEPESLQKVVQAQFPFPIARAYNVFTNSEYADGNKRVKALIDLSESIIYYVYNILVADQLRRLKIENATLKKEMGISYSNYSLARRLDVISLILKLARTDSSIDLFMPEITAIDLQVCRDIQKNIRNVWSHTSTFPESKCQRIIKEYQPRLEKLLHSLKFLTDYKLIQVIRITVRNGRLQHLVLSMMGNNNSSFQHEVEELDKEDILLADSMHVILIAKARGYDYLDLHPFYLVHAWENTGDVDYLCFFKQIAGILPDLRLKVESAHGVGSTVTETDMGFTDLISGKTA